MRVRKYPQSHLVITNDSGKKLIIDPGYLTFEKGFKVSDFQGADLYLITHQHLDHLDVNTIKQVVGNAQVYCNSDVVSKLAEVGVKANEAVNEQKFEVAGFEVTPIDIAHFLVPGKEVPPNTGFVIDGVFFHPGDGGEAPDQLSVDNVGLLIANPWISPGHYEKAIQFAKAVQARLVIPIHFDSRYPADVAEFSQKATEAGLEVRVLNWGEETTIH